MAPAVYVPAAIPFHFGVYVIVHTLLVSVSELFVTVTSSVLDVVPVPSVKLAVISFVHDTLPVYLSSGYAGEAVIVSLAP